MPNKDGTGPLGQGPASGWGKGWCRGWVKGGNYSRGRFGWFRRDIPATEEKSLLQEEAGALKEDLIEIEKRIKELEEK